MSVDDLRRASRQRTEQAEERARTAVQSLSRQGRPISFASVAREAGVSTDFLYRNPQLRSLITDLRGGRRRPPDAPEPAAATSSSVVRALSAQLKDVRARHATEVQELRQALATAQAENLQLRRRLASG